MSQDNIFREVDEELRSERMRKLWRRFSPYVYGAAIVVVLAVAVNEGWAWYQNSNSSQASDQYFAALDLVDKGDVAGGETALNAIATSGNAGYATLAKFKAASLLAKNGKTTEAIAAYDALSTNETNTRLRELALVLAATLLVDNGDVAAVQARVGGIAVDANPMRNAAREAIGLTQYKAGDLPAARATFEAIKADPQVSQNISGRMELYLAQLASEGAAAPAAPADAAAVVPAPTTPVTGGSMMSAAPVAPAVEAPATPMTGGSMMSAAPVAPAPAPETTAPATPISGGSMMSTMPAAPETVPAAVPATTPTPAAVPATPPAPVTTTEPAVPAAGSTTGN